MHHAPRMAKRATGTGQGVQRNCSGRKTGLHAHSPGGTGNREVSAGHRPARIGWVGSIAQCWPSFSHWPCGCSVPTRGGPAAGAGFKAQRPVRAAVPRLVLVALGEDLVSWGPFEHTYGALVARGQNRPLSSPVFRFRWRKCPTPHEAKRGAWSPGRKSSGQPLQWPPSPSSWTPRGIVAFWQGLGQE